MTRVRRIDVLGGLIHEYEPAAARWIRENGPFSLTGLGRRADRAATGGGHLMRNSGSTSPRSASQR